MKFNTYSELEGLHSELSPSTYHWIDYDDDKFDRVIRTRMQTLRGTRHHEIACTLIAERIKLPDTEQTLNRFVNDAIGLRMQPEQILFYSQFAFGTADAIQFRDNLLRIHDLKTGTTRTSMTQLYCYAALFCLEYQVNPVNIEIELRIYQHDKVRIEIADLDKVVYIMDRYVVRSRRIKELRAEMIQ